jgi:cytidylate kinase
MRRRSFWIATDEAIKVARRMQQIVGKEGNVTEERRAQLEQDMKIEIHERDRRDQERGLAPSVMADDMVRIENGEQSIQEVLDEMLSVVRDRGLLV